MGGTGNPQCHVQVREPRARGRSGVADCGGPRDAEVPRGPAWAAGPGRGVGGPTSQAPAFPLRGRGHAQQCPPGHLRGRPRCSGSAPGAGSHHPAPPLSLPARCPACLLGPSSHTPLSSPLWTFPPHLRPGVWSGPTAEPTASRAQATQVPEPGVAAISDPGIQVGPASLSSTPPSHLFPLGATREQRVGTRVAGVELVGDLGIRGRHPAGKGGGGGRWDPRLPPARRVRRSGTATAEMGAHLWGPPPGRATPLTSFSGLLPTLETEGTAM